MQDEKWYEKWLQALREKTPKDVTLKDLLKVSVDVEEHEHDTHMSYARIAAEEQRPGIAAAFEGMAKGEDMNFIKLKQAIKNGGEKEYGKL